jgi:hypothetical protein
MDRYIRIYLVAAFSFLIASCGFPEMQSQSAATSDALEKDLGVKPLIGWRTFNGTFSSLSVTFAEGKVEGMSMGELETHVRTAVGANFKEQPRQILISVSIKP